ncbi:hypothetical protein WA026_009000 [Henosepilachna vigintioctopunctata]|uniref:Uncharacterized protein n=1 Tax=Henosepilachna vigintioctopunctata TaxID=420089 RepID=A0AAW1UMD5_9CUCU
MYEVSNDEDSVEEENSSAVPYSCCNKTAAMSCGHYDLRTYGTCSIYTAGCGKSLKSIAVHYIWILLVLYVISIALQLLLWATYSACRPEKVSSKEDYIMEETTEDVIAQYAMVDGWRGTSNCSKSSDNSGASSDVSSDGDEITSSHKQNKKRMSKNRTR